MKEINIEQLVNETLTVANNVAKEKDTLFSTIKQCIGLIKDDETLIKKYKKQLKLHDTCRSTIFIMLNVAQSETLMRRQHELPPSYQTLYECLKLLNEVERAQFEELIETKKLTPYSSKSDVVQLRKAYKAELIDTNSITQSSNASYSEVLKATESLTHTERLNILEYLIESLTYEERHGLISMYLDEAA